MLDGKQLSALHVIKCLVFHYMIALGKYCLWSNFALASQKKLYRQQKALNASSYSKIVALLINDLGEFDIKRKIWCGLMKGDHHNCLTTFLYVYLNLFLKSDQRFNNNINLWDNNIISLSPQLIPKDIRYNQTSSG